METLRAGGRHCLRVSQGVFDGAFMPRLLGKGKNVAARGSVTNSGESLNFSALNAHFLVWFTLAGRWQSRGAAKRRKPLAALDGRQFKPAPLSSSQTVVSAAAVRRTAKRHKTRANVDVDVVHIRVGHCAAAVVVGAQPSDDRTLLAPHAEVDGVT